MAYSNVTPPTLPSYDSVANPYYLIQFEYAIGAENWETVRFWFGAAPLTWNGSAVTNAVAFSLYTWGTGSPEWTAWGVMAEAGEMALTPGPTTADTYIRIYTNHDILDGTGAVWLAKGTVTPTEEDKEAEIQIRKKSQLAGIIAAWCAPVRQFPQRSPVAFLYGIVKVILPKVTEVPGWDKEKYPHVIVSVGGAYFLSERKHRTMFDSQGRPCIGIEVGETVQKCDLRITVNSINSGLEGAYEFGAVTEQTATGSLYLIGSPNWANYDVLNEDGSVYLKASDPVPVYE